jgi:hypothetical protein
VVIRNRNRLQTVIRVFLWACNHGSQNNKGLVYWYVITVVCKIGKIAEPLVLSRILLALSALKLAVH